MAKQFRIFPGNSVRNLEAYNDAETSVNEWLKEHPETKIIDWKVAICADKEISECAIAILVDVPESEMVETSQGDSKAIQYELIFDGGSSHSVYKSIAELAEQITEHVQPGEVFDVYVNQDGDEIGVGFYNPNDGSSNESGAAEGLMKEIDAAREKITLTVYQLFNINDKGGWYDATPSPAVLLEMIKQSVKSGEQFEIVVYDNEHREIGRGVYSMLDKNGPTLDVLIEKDKAKGLSSMLGKIRDNKGQEG